MPQVPADRLVYARLAASTSINIHLDHVRPPQRHRSYGRNILIALVASGSVFWLEVYASWKTGSLALLSDAAHLLIDLSGLVLAYFALRWASRPATPQATYGFYRAEVLAAGANGVLLVGIVLFLVYRAFQRLRAPLADLDATFVLWVAVVGLGANVVAALMLHRDAQESINTRGAFWNVVGDAVASVGVILAALLVRWTGNPSWDTYVTFVVAGIIAYGAVGLLRSSVAILLEAAPKHLDMEQIKRSVEGIEGVVNVHDLHCWTLTPGQYSLTMHVSIEPDRALTFHHITHAIEDLLEERFGLEHCTIQVEPAGEDPESDRYDPVHGELPL